VSGAIAWRYPLAHPERVEALILVSAGRKGAGPILPFRIPVSPVRRQHDRAASEMPPPYSLNSSDPR